MSSANVSNADLPNGDGVTEVDSRPVGERIRAIRTEIHAHYSQIGIGEDGTTIGVTEEAVRRPDTGDEQGGAA